MNKNTKIILIIVGIIILIGGLVLGVYLTGQKQDFRSSAAPTTTLEVSPSSQSKLPGQTVTFTVFMDTGDNIIKGVDLEIIYDPSIIEIQDFTKGSDISAFDQITKSNIDTNAGTISYSAFTDVATSAINGPSLEVLTISARVLDTAEAGNYSLSFASTSTVAEVETGSDVLLSTTPGSLSVLAAVGAAGTQTASPTASSSATPTSTASPSSSPTATPDTLLDSGVSVPTILSAGVGVVTILLSLLLVF